MGETIAAILVLVFAPGIVGFLIGYAVSRRAAGGRAAASASESPAEAGPAQEPARAEPTAEPAAAAAETEPEPPAGETPATAARRKPRAMKQPRKAGADDLKRIDGIDADLESALNGIGIHHFDQIARWTPENIAWVDDHLELAGRIGREGWTGQAAKLANPES